MRCVTTFEEISSRARLTGCWCLCLATLFFAKGAAYAQDESGGDQMLVPQPVAASGCCTADEASCGYESVNGCSDYGAALSAACDGCTGLGGRSLTMRPRPAIRLLDYALGDCCTGSACCFRGGCGVGVGSGIGVGCGDGLGCGIGGNRGAGGGQFWNRLASGSTVGSFIPNDACSSCGNGLGANLLGRCGERCCGFTPGAGYIGCREPPVRCGMPAPSYPVPFRVPQNVGYTRFTYPPMMPHHSLPHYRHTYSYRHAPGLSRTTVRWRSTTVRNALAKLHHVIELPR
jgi:hypothetical protein